MIFSNIFNLKKTTLNMQLSSVNDFDVKNLVFSEAQSQSIPNTTPAINYKRISIKTKYKNGEIGDLIFSTERLFSFGIGENLNPTTQEVNGYVMPLCLWGKNGCSKAEKRFTDVFESVVEHCKKHLVDNRDDIEKWDLEMNDLKRLNPLYWKKEKGKRVEGVGPILYSKLIVSRKQTKNNGIMTMFFDQQNNPVDPLKLIGKRCFVHGAIKIESIFIGNKISLQVKLYECAVELLDTGMRRLLDSKKNILNLNDTSNVVETKESPPVEEEDEFEDEEPEPEPKPAPKPTRKRVRRKKTSD